MKNLTISLLLTIIVLLVAPFEGVAISGRIIWAVCFTALLTGILTFFDLYKKGSKKL